MKKKAILSIFILLTTFITKTQTIGHVNIFEILENMPEKKRAMQTLKRETESKKNIIKSLEDKLQNKANAFRKKTEKLREIDLKNRFKMQAIQKEQISLQEELKKIEAIKTEALRFLQKKEADLMKPIESKIINSIHKIAKEKGISYVLDSSHQQGIILYTDPIRSNNLTSKIKADLGIK